MSKRYVFWRTPEGKPYRGSDGKHAPAELLAEVGRKSNVTPEGKVTWTSFYFKQLIVALKLAAVVICLDGEELNENDAWAILHSALIEAVKKKGGQQPLDVNEVLDEADAKAADYFRKPDSSYSLVSSLSVKSLPFKRVEVAGCQIDSLPSRRGYSYPEHIQATGGPVIVSHIESSKYQLVRVKTSGRSVHEATDKAFRALHLLRGLWSLFARYGSWTIRLGGVQREPIGVIHTGPVHTLHHPDKTLVGDYFWYERAASEDRKLFQPSRGWNRIEKHRRWAMNRIRALPFRKDVEDLIIRYVIALDQMDHDVAFLQMWSILERLTNTVGTNYDETVERTLRLFSDRSLAKNLLGCIRLRRNLYVHAARSTEEPDQATYLIKSFVDPHLVQVLRNDFAVTSLKEYGEVLSLPTDVATLQRNKKWFAKAIRIVSRKVVAK